MKITRRLSLFLGLAATGLTSAAVAQTNIAQRLDLSYQRPSLSANGRVGAFERMVWGGCPFNCVAYYDIVVGDLGDVTDSGQDVLRELTRDGVSKDPSVTSDGGEVAFRSLINGANVISVVPTNGGLPNFSWVDFTPTIANLEISPTGKFLVWKRLDGVSPGIVRFDRNASFWVTVEGLSTLLSDQNPIDNAGFVYYVRITSGNPTTHRVIRSNGFTWTTLVGPTADRLSEVTVDPTGATVSYSRRLASSGLSRLHALDLSGPTPIDRVVASDTVLGTTFTNVTVNRKGDRVAYSSNGNFASPALNNDRSREVYHVSKFGGFSTQVTNWVAPSPPQPAEHGVLGIAASAGSSVWYGDVTCSPTCGVAIPPGLDAYGLRGKSAVNLAPLSVAIAGQIVTPPFDIIPDSVPCIRFGSLVGCAALIRNSSDAKRSVFSWTEIQFDGPGTCVDSGGLEPFSTFLNLGQQVVRTAMGTNCFGSGPVTGTFRVIATDTQNPAADRVVLAVPFSLP